MHANGEPFVSIEERLKSEDVSLSIVRAKDDFSRTKRTATPVGAVGPHMAKHVHIARS